MSYSCTNASHDYLFARLHGLWANGVNGAQLERAMQSGTLEGLQFNLRPFGIDTSSREALHTSLVSRSYDRLCSICRSLGPEDAAYYQAFISKLYFENLSAILNLRFFPQKSENHEYLFAHHRMLPEFDTERLLEQKSDEAFASQIPLFGFVTREMLMTLVKSIRRTRNVLQMESEIEKIYFSGLLSTAQHASRGVAPEATALVGEEIDIVNLSLLMRSLRTYHLDEATLRQLWIPGGALLHEKNANKLLRSKDMLSMIYLLPEPYRHLLEPFHSADLYLCENALVSHLSAVCVRLFHAFDTPVSSIVAFPYLNRIEATNIERLYESVRMGLPTRDMRDMLML